MRAMPMLPRSRPMLALALVALVALAVSVACRRLAEAPLGRPFELEAGEVVRVSGTSLNRAFGR